MFRATKRLQGRGSFCGKRSHGKGHGFIPGQGRATLDFSDEAEFAQLRRLPETLQLEIMAMLELLNRPRESPDCELCQPSERKSGVLDELVAERK